MLRPAQRFRLPGGIEPGDRAILPRQPAQARLELRGQRTRRCRQYAAVAFHHDIADFRQIGAHQRDACRTVVPGHVAHPFGARPRLAETASGADQPGTPGLARRQLRIAGPAFPVIAAQRGQLVRLQSAGQLLAVAIGLIARAPQPPSAGQIAPVSHFRGPLPLPGVPCAPRHRPPCCGRAYRRSWH